MIKLMILLDEFDEDQWPEFLHLAEKLPGLLRESTSRMVVALYGEPPASLIHELYFASRPALETALASPYGQKAGRLLQTISRGQVRLLMAEYYEESGDALRKRQRGT